MSRILVAIALVAITSASCKSSKNQTEPDPTSGQEVDEQEEESSVGEAAEKEEESPPEDASTGEAESPPDKPPVYEMLDQPSDAELVGQYTNTHGMQVVGDSGEWEMDEATDCLSIKEADDQRMTFAFELYFTNAHTCFMSGVAERDGVGQWVHTEKTEDVDCTLRISVADDNIQLRDVDSGCRTHYCGARGFIDGASFSRDEHDPDPGSCGESP